jgi:hypothetical protein
MDGIGSVLEQAVELIFPSEAFIFNCPIFSDTLVNDLQVHGGLTFSWFLTNITDMPNRLPKQRAFGFDCAHFGDLMPLNLYELNEIDLMRKSKISPRFALEG